MITIRLYCAHKLLLRKIYEWRERRKRGKKDERVRKKQLLLRK